MITEENYFDKQQTTKTTLTILIQYTSIQKHPTGEEKHIDRKSVRQTLNQGISNHINSKQIRSYLPSPQRTLLFRHLLSLRQAALPLLEKGSKAVMLVTIHIHMSSLSLQTGDRGCEMKLELSCLQSDHLCVSVLCMWTCCGL